jgi:signal transduction histidine kinase
VQPLAAIIGAINLVERQFGEYVPPPARRAIQRIGRSAAFIERLVFDLIDLNEVESGRLLLDRRRTELGILVSQVLPEQERIELEIRDSLFAFVDHRRIKRVLATLVDHALSHSTGSIFVRVERHNEHVRVVIADHGPGLTAEQSRCAFDPHPKHPGVPLYVSRKIVEAHGGRISVVSQAGHGTKFALELPWARP